MRSTVPTQNPVHPVRFLPWLLGALLVLGCLVIYRRVGAFDFVAFDDDYNLLFNPHLGPLTLERVRWAFSDWQYARRCMPLGWLGLSAVFSGSGLDPAGYHRAALALHAVNTLLFFGVLYQLAEVGRPGRDPATRRWRWVCAFLGAMFWAWHPLRVESVAWSSGLIYGQAEFFLLLAFNLFVRTPTGPVARLGALGCYGLSLLSYPLAIGFAPVFALVAVWRTKDWGRSLWIALPFGLLAAATTIVNLVARLDAEGAFRPVPTLAEFSLGARAMQAGFVWIYYARIPFWPVGLTPVNPVLLDFNPWSAPLMASAVVMVVFTLACVGWPAVRRTLGPFWLAHLCVLIPLMGLVERPYFPSDRYAAFPQALLAAALVLGLGRLQSASVRTATLAVGLIAGGVLGMLSRQQAEIWRDTPALFQHILKRLSPQVSPMMCFQRPATVRFRDGDEVGALALLDRGIALLPDNHDLKTERVVLQRQGAELQALLASMGGPPSTPPVVLMHQQLGMTAARAGDLAAAWEHIRLAHASAPDFFAPTYNLVQLSLRRGETRAALGYYLWTEVHGGEHLSSRLRSESLRLIADQFAAAGEPRLAAAARARALTVNAAVGK